MKYHVERKCLDTNENVMGYIDFDGSLLEFYKSELNKIENGKYEIISSSFDQDGFHLILFDEREGLYYEISSIPLEFIGD